MNREEVLSLAKLARIELDNDEAESLSGEFRKILDYVGDIKKVDSTTNKTVPSKDDYTVRNVMREDGLPEGGAHQSGVYTEKILEQAPAREGNYIKVKKIL